ncbi:MAG: hypothetical protein E7536_09040 [Ruminococcaceae bacterium]|nr:hypothetical protein [Oscillospiraceae bacterium]
MIDIESEVFTNIETDVLTSFPKAEVRSEEILVPSSFPCATIVEADNHVFDSTQDSSGDENHAVLMYEVNVYSNKASGKKTECKAVFQIIDTRFSKMGFTRKSMVPQTTNNGTVYRIIARYQAVVSKEKVIYRR